MRTLAASVAYGLVGSVALHSVADIQSLSFMQIICFWALIVGADTLYSAIIKGRP